MATGSSSDVEPLGLVELALVQVGGAPHEQHPRVRRDRRAVHLDVAGGLAGADLGGWLASQHLLDRVREALGVVDEGPPLVGVVGQ